MARISLKLTIPRPDYTKVITVLVVQEERSFLVHEATVCEKSPFFKAACNGERWASGREGVVTLPTHDPKSFDVFLHWVFTDKVDVELIREGPQAVYAPLARILPLADFLGATALSNLITDELLKYSRTSTTWPGGTAFQNLSRGTAVWRLLVDTTANKGSADLLENLKDGYPTDIFLDIAKLLMSGETKTSLDPQKRDGCHYHDHTGEEKCT